MAQAVCRFAVFGLIILLFAPTALADHGASEPSDGTVNSFRWLETPFPVSDITIKDGSGRPVNFTQFKGKVVLLNLWASWCPPCIRELPALDRLQKRLGGDRFLVVAVALDENPELARAMFHERLELQHLTLFVDPDKQVNGFFPVGVLPANFFLDAEGRAMGMLRSYVDWDDLEVDMLVKRLVGGVASATLRAEKLARDQQTR